MYQRLNKIVSEEELKRTISAEALRQKKQAFDKELCRIFDDKGRFLLIIGPCSADDHDYVMSYCEKLCGIYENVKDKFFIVPRLYTTKPRSEAGAYRGMLHAPDRTNEDMARGIVAARKLMVDVAKNFGLFGADEMLYPDLLPYFDDILSYITIGSRSSEDQFHRLVASCLEVPVGIKNPMQGDLVSLAKGVKIVGLPNRFIFNGFEVLSSGNKYAHAILRGYADSKGEMFANYSQSFVSEYAAACEATGVRSAVIIDCNHFNSGKHCNKEADIAKIALKQSLADENIKGIMIESYLMDGKQDRPVYAGRSLTDECIGIEETERLIYDLAEML